MPRKRRSADGGEPFDAGAFNHVVEHFALIYGTDTVWDGHRRLMMRIGALRLAYGNDHVRLWLGCDRRRVVLPEDVVFDPTGNCDEDRHINLFAGWPLEPEEGDVGPFLQLARFLCSRAADSADDCDQLMHWLLSWLAWPLQHPGAKLRTAVVMSGSEGAGKNLLFETVAEIYGRYAVVVGQDELEDRFNDWRSAKLFVIGDEVSSRAELVHNKNRLKALVTSPTVQINAKNMARRQEDNHINVVFLSNELQPLALDNSDRRYCVIHTPPARERMFYERFGQWRRNGGAARLYRYLLDYPLADFDPFAPAPKTAAKRELIGLSAKTPERFWLEWHAGEIDLPYASCSAAQAYRAYTKYAQRVGDRFPVQRQVFTALVTRVADLHGERVTVRVMQVARGGVKTVATRMLLVAAPPDHGLGQWATDAEASFELALRRYLHSPASPDGVESPAHETMT